MIRLSAVIPVSFVLRVLISSETSKKIKEAAITEGLAVRIMILALFFRRGRAVFMLFPPFPGKLYHLFPRIAKESSSVPLRGAPRGGERPGELIFFLTSADRGAMITKLPNARVVELADSLDSGSSAHSGRAGSSPASRTKKVPKIAQ